MRLAVPRPARFMLLLAAFAACVQWMIPHGWMVASAHEGAGEPALLVPCPATSPELAALAGHAAGAHDAHRAHHGGMDHSATGHGDGGAEGGDATHGAAQAQCDFAAVGAPVLPPDAPALVASAPQVAAPVPAFRAVQPGRGLAAPPPPSTGPPSPKA